MDLRTACSLKRSSIEEGTAATAAIYVRLAENVLEILRSLPPETEVEDGRLLEVRLSKESFQRIFAGCEVRCKKWNGSGASWETTLYVFVGSVKVSTSWWETFKVNSSLVESVHRLPEEPPATPRS